MHQLINEPVARAIAEDRRRRAARLAYLRVAHRGPPRPSRAPVRVAVRLARRVSRASSPA